MRNPTVLVGCCRLHRGVHKFIRFVLFPAMLALLPGMLLAQLGIGTKFPKEKLHVFGGSVYAESKQPDPVNNTFPPKDSVKFVAQWFHEKGAFRSMTERSGTGSLDPVNIGPLSFATGYENFAIGTGALAVGRDVFVAGLFAAGLGEQITASGDYTFAQGYDVVASGLHSVALGTRISTNSQTGSFIFGDNGGGTSQNDAKNQMMMRFSGGYKLFTSSLNLTGVEMIAGGNAWSVISDVHKKENFAPVNGEYILEKISKMPLSTWNYKGQDSKTFRHYGPMAQDFFQAFGKDSHGTIGTDTTINQADFDGVNLIAIQALAKRTEFLQAQNDRLQLEITALREQMGLARKHVKKKKSALSAR
ncbi:MAG: tail fiber domain-containing protein [Dyadobacter fermentans]